MLLQPGSPVRVEMNAGEFDDQVRASLERKVQNNGWKLDTSAPNVLSAEIKRGETEEVTYDFEGRRPNETVSVTPTFTRCGFQFDGDTAWEVTASPGIPRLIAISRKESLQDEVSRSPTSGCEVFETG